jgi:hypothetical protein
LDFIDIGVSGLVNICGPGFLLSPYCLMQIQWPIENKNAKRSESFIVGNEINKQAGQIAITKHLQFNEEKYMCFHRFTP